MRRASLGNASLARLFGEPIIKPGFGEGFAELSLKKEIPLRQRRDRCKRRFELRQKRNVDLGSGLFLLIDKPSTGHMLRPQTDHMAAAWCRTQKQF